MNEVEKIEYYLGKDRLPNLHWKPKIPAVYDIPVIAGSDLHFCTSAASYFHSIVDNADLICNNLGYRSNFDYNQDLKNVVLVLGDSHVVGMGVEFDKIFSSQLQNLVDYTVVNLGICALSPDGMTRIGAQTIKALQREVKHVCVVWPTFSLREVVNKNYKAGVYTTSETLPHADWWDHIDWVSNNYNYQKNKLLLESLTASVGAEYHDLIINLDAKDPKLTTRQSDIVYKDDIRYTRLDENSHQAIANYFHKRITHQPSLFEQRSRSLTDKIQPQAETRV